MDDIPKMKYLLLLLFLVSCNREAGVSFANIKVMADKQQELLKANVDTNSKNVKTLAEAIKIEATTGERYLGTTEAPTISATMSAAEIKEKVIYREVTKVEYSWGWLSAAGAAALAFAGLFAKTLLRSNLLGSVLTSVVTAVQEYKENMREARPALATQLSKTLEKHSNEKTKKVVEEIKKKKVKATSAPKKKD